MKLGRELATISGQVVYLETWQENVKFCALTLALELETNPVTIANPKSPVHDLLRQLIDVIDRE